MQHSCYVQEIEHLDGHKVTLSSVGVTRPGDFVQIKSEGMPLHNEVSRFGDLWVHYTVDFPWTLTEEQKKTVRDMFGGAAKA